MIGKKKTVVNLLLFSFDQSQTRNIVLGYKSQTVLLFKKKTYLIYFVLDYVYFETSSTSPYQIRRIEELNKTPSGNVEAKVMCFYRRRDLPPQLIQLADKHQCKLTLTSFIVKT